MDTVPTYFGTFLKETIYAVWVSSKGNPNSPNIQISYWPDFYPNNTARVRIDVHRPKTKGWVRLQSSDPLVSPLVALRDPDVDPEDIEALAWGVEFVRNIIRFPPMAQIVDQEISPALYDLPSLRSILD